MNLYYIEQEYSQEINVLHKMVVSAENEYEAAKYFPAPNHCETNISVKLIGTSFVPACVIVDMDIDLPV